MTVTNESELEKDLTGAEREAVLARWERAGKLLCRTRLGGWLDDGNGPRMKTRQYLVNGEVLVEHDGRQPFPTVEQFAMISLAVMACA